VQKHNYLRTMETLKPRAEVLLPDIRNRNRANFDHSTGVISEMTFDSVYDEVEKIRITTLRQSQFGATLR
jgi:hypothetical protein